MKNVLGDKARLQHILDAIHDARSMLDGVSLETFVENKMMRLACIKAIEIIGEAANHITKETQQKFSDIEWRQIIGTRNIFIHEYYDINRQIVYNIITIELPVLEQKVHRVLDAFK